MGYSVIPNDAPDTGFYDSTVGTAINIAADACDEINKVLQDISPDSILGNAEAAPVLADYNITLSGGSISINSAAGAMVVDDLMQKISTKVQVAAQLLSTANNIAKTATRIMQQG